MLFAPLSTLASGTAIAGIAVAVGSLVLVVARDLDRGPDWGVRLSRAALVATVVSFVATVTVTPPDPLTRLVYGAPALGIGLLLAHVVVTSDVDRRLAKRT